MVTSPIVPSSPDSEPPERPCYAMSLVRPFLEVLAERQELRAALEQLELCEPDDRLSIRSVHAMLDAAVLYTGELDIGLKAARRVRLGDMGVIDYLVSSVETTGEALEVATRYMRLVNDALHVAIATDGIRATVHLDNGVVMPRAADAFQLGGLYRIHLRHWLRDALPEVEVWTTQSPPADETEYRLTFAPAVVRFDAPLSGFVFPARLLGARLPEADPGLHRVLRQQAEHIVGELPRAQSFTSRVREIVGRELGKGDPTAPRVAKRLGMSTSTLTRRLESEGSSFRDILGELRKRLAIQYVMNRDLELAEVALLLGFSRSPAFYRAFRRWTGQTPLEYRRHGKW